MARALSLSLQQAGHHVGRIISAHRDHARALAEERGARWSDDAGFIDPAADVVVLAVTDSALYKLAEELRLKDQLVVHTAGGVPLQAIADISSRTGVFYPLQTFSRMREAASPFPLLLEVNDAACRPVLERLAGSISDQVRWLSSEERLKMHVAGVFCNNFINRLAAMAQDYCARESLDFTLLDPLLAETFERIKTGRAGQLQTGPARRGDTGTLAAHRRVLEAYPGMQQIYRIFSDEIQDFYKNKTT